MPDRAWITISAESRARNPKDAQRRNAEGMTPVIDKLRAAGDLLELAVGSGATSVGGVRFDLR